MVKKESNNLDAKKIKPPKIKPPESNNKISDLNKPYIKMSTSHSDQNSIKDKSTMKNALGYKFEKKKKETTDESM